MFVLLAQVPGQKPAEDALGSIASHGILGALSAILIVALFFAVRALLKAKDDRFSDHKAMADALQQVNNANHALVVEMNRSTTALVADAARHHDSVKTTLNIQDKSVQELAKTINQLQQDHVRLLARLDKGGSKG